MAGGWKGPHVDSDRSNDGLDRNSTQCGHLVQPLDDVAKEHDRVLYSQVERNNAFLQPLDGLQMLGKKERMVFADSAGNRRPARPPDLSIPYSRTER